MNLKRSDYSYRQSSYQTYPLSRNIQFYLKILLLIVIFIFGIVAFAQNKLAYSDQKIDYLIIDMKEVNNIEQIYYKLVSENVRSDVSKWQRSGGWRRYAAYVDEEMHIPMSIHEWALLMSTSTSDLCQSKLTNILQNVPYEAFFFETKGVTIDSMKEKQFEFVVVNAPSLDEMTKDGIADEYAFSSFLDSLPSDDVGAVFENLGHDATLVSPRRINGSNPMYYMHLASFLRNISSQTSNQMWRLVCKTYLDVIKYRGKGTTWLSTSGLGGMSFYLFVRTLFTYYFYPVFP